MAGACPLARACEWTVISAVAGTWWFKGAVPVGLMFAGATLMVVAARSSTAHKLADGPVFGAWVSLLARPGMLAVLLFILTFKLGDAAMGFMVKPFWVDSGTAAEIGLVSVNVGLGSSIAPRRCVFAVDVQARGVRQGRQQACGRTEDYVLW